jgi:hypothetical protein
VKTEFSRKMSSIIHNHSSIFSTKKRKKTKKSKRGSKNSDDMIYSLINIAIISSDNFNQNHPYSRFLLAFH